MGGHIVQGHVDGVGRVQSVEAEGEGIRVIVEAPAETMRYCVEKGSITVEGVSLTIAELDDEPSRGADPAHARRDHPRRPPAGREVNLEVDVLAKYVESLLVARR